MTQLTFANLIDDGILGMLEANAAMFDIVDPDKIKGTFYDADMSVPRITFGPQSDTPIHARAAWLGSAAPGPGTWLWGWENVNNYPPAAVEAATRVRQVGTDFSVPELVNPEIPLQGTVVETAWKFAIVGSVINGCLPTYFVRPGGQTVGVILVDHPQLRWQPPSVVRVTRVITEAIGTGYVSDWHRASRQYASMRGLGLVESDDDLRLTLPDGATVEVELDDAGRATAVAAQS